MPRIKKFNPSPKNMEKRKLISDGLKKGKSYAKIIEAGKRAGISILKSAISEVRRGLNFTPRKRGPALNPEKKSAALEFLKKPYSLRVIEAIGKAIGIPLSSPFLAHLDNLLGIRTEEWKKNNPDIVTVRKKSAFKKVLREEVEIFNQKNKKKKPANSQKYANPYLNPALGISNTDIAERLDLAGEKIKKIKALGKEANKQEAKQVWIDYFLLVEARLIRRLQTEEFNYSPEEILVGIKRKIAKVKASLAIVDKW